MADPSAEGASALALLAPYAEMKKTGETALSIEEKTVPVAQTYGERAVAGSATETDLSTITASSTQLVPATEQAYLAARRSNDQLTLVAPKTGVPMLQYPLIDVNRGSNGHPRLRRRPVGARGPRPGSLVRLERRRGGHRGRRAPRPRRRRAAQRHRPRHAPVLAKVAQKTTDDTLRQWRVLSVPSSILAVVDLSGSMKMAIGDTTRIGLAVTLAGRARRLPGAGPDRHLGLLQEPRRERRLVRRVRPARAPRRPRGRRQDARRRGPRRGRRPPSRVRGGTGVMDSTLAAYKHAQEMWDPAWFNSVVIMTDGASDDSSSLSLDSLVNQLKSLRDPAKPVKVIIIGISQDVRHR